MADFIKKKQRIITYLYLLIMLLLLTACGLFQWLDIESVDNYFFLSLFLALGLGMLHIAGLRRYCMVDLVVNYLLAFIITIVMMLASCILLFFLYHYLKLNYYFITFEFGFIIPVFVWQTYQFFKQIPYGEYKLWYYPVDEDMPDLDMIDLSEIEVVQFVFNKKAEDAKKINFTSKAPLNMSLGQLFFIFINDYNEKNAQQTISYLDNENLPQGWLFYKEKGFFKSRYYYDPELSFRENAIIPNQTIYAIRKFPPAQAAIAVENVPGTPAQ